MTADRIYHMTPIHAWQTQQGATAFTAPSLEEEGFIHCTGDLALLTWVANRFYREDPAAYVILYIDPSALDAEVRWEEVDGHQFPHVYGPIATAAVAEVLPFGRAEDGRFLPLAETR